MCCVMTVNATKAPDDHKDHDNDVTNTCWPAEYDVWHAACLILYPHNAGTFNDLPKARAEIEHFCHCLLTAGQESVLLLLPSTGSVTDDDVLAKEVIQRILLDENHKGDSVSDEAITKNADGTPPPTLVVATCPSNDTWARDTAPTMVFAQSINNDATNAVMQALDWRFNAYGGPEEGCYWPCTLDQDIPRQVCQLLQSTTSNKTLETATTATSDALIPCILPSQAHVIPLAMFGSKPTTIQHVEIDNLVLEGGAIHTDGQGTVLTTCECLLNPNRNPNLSKDQVESILKRHLGCTKVLWLPYGLAFDDDTNGHIDNWCCFVRPGHVVLAWTDQTEDEENYKRCRQANDILQQSTDAKGQPITVHKLFLPNPIYYSNEDVNSLATTIDAINQESNADHSNVATNAADSENQLSHMVERRVQQRMAASYINYYVANHALLVPQYGDTHYDALAISTLQDILDKGPPKYHKQVIGVPSRELLIGGGNLHCMTQQIPNPNMWR